MNTIEDSYKTYKIQKAKELYNEACQLKEQNKFDLSLRFFESAFEIDPSNKLAFRELLEIYKDQNEFNKSVLAFKKLIKAKNTESNYYLYSKYLYENQKYKYSVLYLKKSLSLNRKFLPSHILLAEIYFEHNSILKAETFLKNSIQLDSSNTKVLLMLIDISYSQKNLSDCINYLNSYLKLNPIDKEEIFRKVIVLIQLKKNTEAFLALKEFLDIYSNNLFIDSMLQKRIQSNSEDADFQVQIQNLKVKKIQEIETITDSKTKQNLLLELSLINLFLGQYKKALNYIIQSIQIKYN